MYFGYLILCINHALKLHAVADGLKCDIRWVPFDIAKPLLDRMRYAVLSDYGTFQGGDSFPPNVSEHDMMQQHDDMGQGDCNDVFMCEDEGDDEVEYESSDDESGGETSSSASSRIESEDINNIVIGLKGICLRYEELQRAFGPSERSYIKNQVRRYLRFVGAEISKRRSYYSSWWDSVNSSSSHYQPAIV